MDMWFSRKDEKRGLPELPPAKFPVLRRLPEGPIPSISGSTSFVNPPANQNKPMIKEIKDDDEHDDLEIERHSLPSFPEPLMRKGFAQAAIKEAVSPMREEKPVIPRVPQFSPNKFKAIELPEEDWDTHPPDLNEDEISLPRAIKLPELRPFSKPSYSPAQQTMPKSVEQKQNVFVKLDKFHSARRTLSETRMKLDEIEELLHKIRETKMREEQELSSWEKEVTTIKSKLQEIRENIFEKVE